jgi:predicted AlkP superfamily pyrophosphatase or phosphodiesterase
MTGSRWAGARYWRCMLALVLLLPIMGLMAGLPAASDPATGRVNAPDPHDKPYLVLVSIDGFRWDYPGLYETPALDRIAARGLKAAAMQPVFPTLTFPNHYSIATGLPPAQHGLVANEFPGDDGQRWYHYKDRSTVQDGSWYQAEPIWVTVERAGMLSAAFYFVGTEADVAGIRPTHWRAFDAAVSGDDRVAQVLDWLAEPADQRPHLVTLYFDDVDDNTHQHGPGSPESRAAIRRVDRQLGLLLDGIQALPHGDRVYLLLVSDHGMAAYRSDDEPLVLDRVVDLAGVRAVDGGPYTYLYFDADARARIEATRDAINAAWSCGRALTAADTPAAWQVTANPRFPDLFVQADPGCAVISSCSKRHKITPGDHGWAPEMPEMQGIFYALGPGISAGSRAGVVHVTEVYPLMLAILGLDDPRRVRGGSGPLSALLNSLAPTTGAPP